VHIEVRSRDWKLSSLNNIGSGGENGVVDEFRIRERVMEKDSDGCGNCNRRVSTEGNDGGQCLRNFFLEFAYYIRRLEAVFTFPNVVSNQLRKKHNCILL
jgi:hypothetical protein